jgi:AcrR family transcriptional regulator
MTPRLRAPSTDPGALDPERERIYEALAELVVERGLPEVQLEDVLESARIGRELFERHFDDLQDCFDRLWEEMTAEYTSAWNASFAGEASWRDRLRSAAYLTLRYFTEDPTRAAFFMVGAQSGGEVAQARRDRMIARGIEMIDEARTELPDPDSVPRSEAEAVVGAIYQAILGAAGEGSPDRMVEAVPQLMYLAVLPYQGAEAAQEELERGPRDLARYHSGDL